MRARRSRFGGVGRCAAAFVALSFSQAQLRAETALCDANSTVTPIGLDSSSGLTLLSIVAPADPSHRWIVAYLPGAAAALAYPDTVPGRYSGSVARGPVISVAPCGSGCLQPLVWKEGSWQSLGEPLPAADSTSASATYDASGVPWLLLQKQSATPGTSQAWAYRLERGEWRPRGNILAAGLGSPSGGTAESAGAITLGTAQFSAEAPPSAWLDGLPSVPAERRGALLRLGTVDAAYLAADGVIYRTADRGKRWQRVTWTPGDVGGRAGAVGSWRQGVDTSVDLPYGTQGETLDLAWFDRGTGAAGEHLFLSRLTLPDRWETLAELPASVTTKGPEPLPLTHILQPKADLWVLLFGCAATADGSGLVVRTLEGKALSAPSFVPLRRAVP